jgi:hypothetical protein
MLAMKNGETVRAPLAFHFSRFSINRYGPPPPEPKITPMSSRLSSVISRPESSSAIFDAATPRTTLRSVRRMALKSIHLVPSKSFTSPLICAS